MGRPVLACDGGRARVGAGAEHDRRARHLRRRARREGRAPRIQAPAPLRALPGERGVTMEGSRLPTRTSNPLPGRPESQTNLADILERVLDKGIVIAGDIQINLLDIELLTIKLRLLIASVDRAREMVINWWESDASLQKLDPGESSDGRRLEQENRELRERLERLERQLGVGSEGDD